MKRYLFILSLILSQRLFCQQADSVQIHLSSGSDIYELKDYFEASDIDYYRIFLKNSLKKKVYFNVVVKEFRNGFNVKTDTLFSEKVAQKYLVVPANDSSFSFSLLIKPEANNSKFFRFRFPNVSMKKSYLTDDTDEYSLRSLISTQSHNSYIPINSTVPIFAYSLPYYDPSKPGWKSYCDLTKERVYPEKWWNQYHVKHFIIIYIKLQYID